MSKRGKRGGRKSSNQQRHKRSRTRTKRQLAHGFMPDAQASGGDGDGNGTGPRVFFIDEWEATDLFRKQGGRIQRSDRSDKISDAPVKVLLNGRRPGRPVVPQIMGMERDKASQWMQMSKDITAAQIRKDQRREERDAARDARFLDAETRRSATWHRQDADHEGHAMFSILASTSKGGDDKATQWQDAIGTYRHWTGTYRVGSVTWGGAMSEPDANGDRHKVGFDFAEWEYPQGHPSVGKPIEFVDEKHVHRTIKLMLMEGELEGYDRKDPAFRDRIGKRLREWSHRDDEWNRDYVQPAEDALHVDEVKEPRDDDDWDFRYTAEIGAERSLRDEVGSAAMLTAVQQRRHTHDSE